MLRSEVRDREGILIGIMVSGLAHQTTQTLGQTDGSTHTQ